MALNRNLFRIVNNYSVLLHFKCFVYFFTLSVFLQFKHSLLIIIDQLRISER